ncbi:glycosyl hydrolase family 43 [Neolewinella xylanilytica]|uniref:Glycosyl hydrolase family 43 n=1 Tax=Neolewinella xylanilytica TaxID=1514080 RepID=A0A2S6IAD4_9BACT|nr:glycoside hydrolase family 43 protein [Neolewinella xylanilytica]PPK88419.1 glycosyl hydrolase family 43 [Neolewinella xylanilytica]
MDFLLLLTALGWLSPTPPQDSAYVFSYFQGNGEDGLHLAFSYDGLSWTPLNGNEPVLTPAVGEDKLMRDPCIIRGGDGQFHLVWTVSWHERGIGYAHSPDLINWSEQRYLPVMEHEPDARNSWAPEITYDATEDRYLIYWATTIPGRFPETDSSGDNGLNHRMYYTLTEDFQEFTPTAVLYDRGFNVIDATIQPANGEYVMFLKDETKHPVAQKNIRIATAKELAGPYTPAGAPITGHWVEGPTVTIIDGDWVVYFDRYTNHAMGAVRSSDLENWTDISDQLSFPEGTRHGTVVRVTKGELQKLRDTFPD